MKLVDCLEEVNLKCPFQEGLHILASASSSTLSLHSFLLVGTTATLGCLPFHGPAMHLLFQPLHGFPCLLPSGLPGEPSFTLQSPAQLLLLLGVFLLSLSGKVSYSLYTPFTPQLGLESVISGLSPQLGCISRNEDLFSYFCVSSAGHMDDYQ